jgi:formylmethanofuran dehydrogenase subunit C
MQGGRIVVRGSAGRRLGGAYAGSRAGMTGGEILVHGDAGEEAAAGIRRGLVAVGGGAGEAAGLSGLAGTLVVLGALGAKAGAGMKRSSIVAMTEPPLLPGYAKASTYRPLFVRLMLRRLRDLGLPVTDAQVEGRYTRWSGDALELNRGEILILETPA